MQQKNQNLNQMRRPATQIIPANVQYVQYPIQSDPYVQQLLPQNGLISHAPIYLQPPQILIMSQAPLIYYPDNQHQNNVQYMPAQMFERPSLPYPNMIQTATNIQNVRRVAPNILKVNPQNARHAQVIDRQKFVPAMMNLSVQNQADPPTESPPEYSMEGGMYLPAQEMNLTCSVDSVQNQADPSTEKNLDGQEPVPWPNWYSEFVLNKSIKHLKCFLKGNENDKFKKIGICIYCERSVTIYYYRYSKWFYNAHDMSQHKKKCIGMKGFRDQQLYKSKTVNRGKWEEMDKKVIAIYKRVEREKDTKNKRKYDDVEAKEEQQNEEKRPKETPSKEPPLTSTPAESPNNENKRPKETPSKEPPLTSTPAVLSTV